MSPNGLERLLKGLEGHHVDSVDITSEDGFSHIKMSVIKLDPDALQATIGSPKELKFSVMWKRTFDRMLDELDKKLTEQDKKLTEAVSELKGSVENLKEIDLKREA